MTTNLTDKEILNKLDKCHSIIGAMCKEGRGPKMSIPARPDVDEDLVISSAINDAQQFIAAPSSRTLTAEADIERVRRLAAEDSMAEQAKRLAAEASLAAAQERVVELEKSRSFLQESMARVAQAEGISTPLMLMAMAENNEETYTDILVKHINTQKDEQSATITAQAKEIERLQQELEFIKAHSAIPAPDCNYLSPAGMTCFKCGRVHSGTKLATMLRSSALTQPQPEGQSTEFTDEEIAGYFEKANQPSAKVDEILANTPETFTELLNQQPKEGQSHE